MQENVSGIKRYGRAEKVKLSLLMVEKMLKKNNIKKKIILILWLGVVVLEIIFRVLNITQMIGTMKGTCTLTVIITL